MTTHRRPPTAAQRRDAAARARPPDTRPAPARPPATPADDSDLDAADTPENRAAMAEALDWPLERIGQVMVDQRRLRQLYRGAPATGPGELAAVRERLAEFRARAVGRDLAPADWRHEAGLK